MRGPALLSAHVVHLALLVHGAVAFDAPALRGATSVGTPVLNFAVYHFSGGTFQQVNNPDPAEVNACNHTFPSGMPPTAATGDVHCVYDVQAKRAVHVSGYNTTRNIPIYSTGFLLSGSASGDSRPWPHTQLGPATGFITGATTAKQYDEDLAPVDGTPPKQGLCPDLGSPESRGHLVALSMMMTNTTSRAATCNFFNAVPTCNSGHGVAFDGVIWNTFERAIIDAVQKDKSRGIHYMAGPSPITLYALPTILGSSESDPLARNVLADVPKHVWAAVVDQQQQYASAWMCENRDRSAFASGDMRIPCYLNKCTIMTVAQLEATLGFEIFPGVSPNVRTTDSRAYFALPKIASPTDQCPQ